MRRRTLLNLALLGLVAMLGIVAALAPDRAPPGSRGTLLPGVSPMPSRIVIERTGKATLEFRREGTVWHMRTPRVAPAHPRRVRDLLDVPALPVVTTLEAGRESWPAFGLAPPAATLHLDDATVSFGTTEALDGRRYALHAGRVQLVAERVFPLLLQGAEFFVDPRLLRAGLEPVRIETPLRRLERVDGTWRDVAAAGAPPAADVARAWETLEAQAVQFAVDADGGVPVAIELAGGAGVTFQFHGQEGQPWLTRRDLGLRFLLDADQVRELALATATPATTGPDAATP